MVAPGMLITGGNTEVDFTNGSVTARVGGGGRQDDVVRGLENEDEPPVESITPGGAAEGLEDLTVFDGQGSAAEVDGRLHGDFSAVIGLFFYSLDIRIVSL